MVYKVGKGGFRSGNTIRKGVMKLSGYRKLRTTAYIVRSHVGHDHHCSLSTVGAFGEEESMPDGVEFSLNKQNRWELPQVIEHIIHKSDLTDEDGYGVQMAVRCNNKRKGCVRVCASDGIACGQHFDRYTRVKAKSRGYFNAESALEIAKPKKLSKGQKRSYTNVVENEENEAAFHRQQIRYSITVPTDGTSYISHDTSFGKERISKPKTSRYHKRKHFDYDYAQDFFDYDLSDDEDTTADTDDWEDNDRAATTFKDVFTFTNGTEKLMFPKEWETSDIAASQIEHDTSKVENMDFSADGILETSKIPVILEANDITAHKLTTIYGSSYYECRCLPRKFIIDITKKMQEAVAKGSDLSLNESVCLVFEHDVNNSISTDQQPIFLVSLKAPNCGSISTIFAYMETGIAEVIERTIFCLDSLFLLTDTDDSKYISEIIAPTPAQMVEQSYNWQTKSYRPSDHTLLTCLLTGQPQSQHQESIQIEEDFEVVDVENSFPVESQAECPICCETLDKPDDGIMLIRCGHIFCYSCMRGYLQNEITIGSCNIKCPEFECKSSIDPGTIITFLQYTDVIQLANIFHNNFVSLNQDMLWCPNRECGRALQVNGLEVDIAHCPCGKMTCSKCLEEAHWPAECETVKEHTKKLRESGDMRFIETVVYSTFHVYVKKCPTCKAPVEKLGGCNCVSCICGNPFCWGCGRPWSDGQHSGLCGTLGTTDRYGTFRLYFSSFDLDSFGNREHWYKKALEHRLNVHPTKLDVIKKAAKPLIITLRKYLENGCQSNRYTLELGMLDGPHTPAANRAASFFNNLLDTYTEVNKILENTSVLLSTWAVVEEDDKRFENEVKSISKISDEIWDLFDIELNCGQPPIWIIRECNKVRERAQKKLHQFIAFVRSLESS